MRQSNARIVGVRNDPSISTIGHFFAPWSPGGHKRIIKYGHTARTDETTLAILYDKKLLFGLIDFNLAWRFRYKRPKV